MATKLQAITYPLTLPDTDSIQEIGVRAVNYNGLFRSPNTRQRRLQRWMGQAWEYSVKLIPMTRAEAAPWLSFLADLQGMKGYFLMGDPLCWNPRGSATDADGNLDPLIVSTNGLEMAGFPDVSSAEKYNYGTKITVVGWGQNKTNVLLEGDYIQIGVGLNSRIYKVLEDVSSNNALEADIYIWPSLYRLSDAPEGTEVRVVNTVGVFSLLSPEFSVEMSPPGYYDISFACRSIGQ